MGNNVHLPCPELLAVWTKGQIEGPYMVYGYTAEQVRSAILNDRVWRAADPSKLPSRFQIGDEVVVSGGAGRHTITSVTFTRSKVVYALDSGLLVDSDAVSPVPALRVVAKEDTL